MKLFDFKYKNDFGHDFYFYVLKGKRYSFLHLTINWSDFMGLPYLQIHFGNGRLVGALFWAFRFGFDFDLIGRTWYSEDEGN